MFQYVKVFILNVDRILNDTLKSKIQYPCIKYVYSISEQMTTIGEVILLKEFGVFMSPFPE